MGMLSKAIKSDVLTGNTKYRNGQEKIGEIIEYNEIHYLLTIYHAVFLMLIQFLGVTQ